MLYLTIEKRLQDGIGKVPAATGARWRFYRRISSDYRRISSNRLSIGGSIQGVSAEILSFKISWQAHYLVRLEGDYLLHALEMTFHMWRRSLMTFILRGRRSIWWGSRLILLAARIGHDDSYVTQIIDDIHLVWQAQYLVKLDGGSCCAAHCTWRLQFHDDVIDPLLRK